MRSTLVLFSVVLLIAFVNAQRKPNITKPVVNLEKRPRPPIWKRPPEERRKLAIFPRNNVKFVVTPKAEVNNEDAANQGLPMTTKRPLVRKFTMQDRQEKRTWFFAPRKPLMKTNRFTVTITPPLSSNRKAIDEMKSEESNKVDTVTSRLNTEKPSSKEHKLNKGNLIQMMQIKNMERPVLKSSEKVEKKFIEEETSQIINRNDTNDFDAIQMNDNSTSKLDKVSKNYPIDIRRLNDEDVIVSVNETENELGSVKLNQTEVNTEVSKDFLESRAIDLNELKYAIEQHGSNSLTLDNEESNNYSTAQILSFNDLEILLEKIVNNTESSTADFDENPSNSPKNETKDTLEDIPKFDVTKPSEFYDVISLSDDEANKTNLEEAIKVFSSVLHGPLMANEEKHSASETNVLNGDDFTEHVADSLVAGNLESLINYTKDTTSYESHYQRSENLSFQRGIITESEETKTNTKDSINHFTNDTEYKNKTEFPRELSSNSTDSFNSTEILLEMYESDMSLSSEELPDELVTETPNESVTENVSLTIVGIPNEAFIESVPINDILKETTSDTSNSYIKERSNETSIDISTGEEISNKSSSNMAGEELSNESSSFIEEIPIESSNNFTGEEMSNESSLNMAAEEISNESYPDRSSNLTKEGASEYIIETSSNFAGVEISNDSASNMAAEEISNESYPDKSSNLTEEGASEYIIETSRNFTGEEISNESASNMAAEEISNESYPDRSSNLTEEGASEYIIETSNNFTGEEISNESPSNMAAEEISNESYPDRSSNLTEEGASEYIIETSRNFTGEEISNESASNMAAEEISNESYPDRSSNLTEEGASEYVIETSNNVTGEEISNESASNMAAEEISNDSDKSHLTEEISSGSTTEIPQSSIVEETYQASDIIIDERISEKSVGSSLDLEISEEALTNRFKRSNNIIEEENLPTTVSGFKYTGNEITLKHDLSYKNINA